MSLRQSTHVLKLNCLFRTVQEDDFDDANDEEADEEEESMSWFHGKEMMVSSSNNLDVDPGQSEIDVIRQWFVNVFQPVEKTADLVVKDFKFQHVLVDDSEVTR